VLVEAGRTRVLCTVSVVDGVPPWLQSQGQAWLTAEYAMLPSATPQRKPRDGRMGRIDGRSVEIQRLIGRVLRSVVDLRAMPEVTLWVDCDVLTADGGTRTAAINGASVALHDALLDLTRRDRLAKWPMRGMVSAISVGIVGAEAMVDLDYREDAAASVDLNVACLSDGRLVEIQGAAEGEPFSPAELAEMLQLGRDACARIAVLQQEAVDRA
jgi:ribonuclease PH